MRIEKGVIIVAYKVSRRNRRYLVLNRTKNWEGWELPKGHLEESYMETVKMELEEEAGISTGDIQEVEDLERTVKWSYEDDGEQVKREYRAYLVEVSDDAYVDTDSNPHDEHEKGFFFDIDDASSLLTYEDHEELLKETDRLIERRK